MQSEVQEFYPQLWRAPTVLKIKRRDETSLVSPFYILVKTLMTFNPLVAKLK